MEDYFSYDDSSDSDFESISISNNNNYRDYETNSFHDRIKNKQVETLKLLRKTLNENKILKNRINLIEHELDELRNNFNISDAIKPRKTSLAKEKTMLDDDDQIEKKTNEKLNDITKIDQYIQTSPLPNLEINHPVDSKIQIEETNIRIESAKPRVVESALLNNVSPNHFVTKTPTFIKSRAVTPASTFQTIVLIDQESQCDPIIDSDKQTMLIDLQNRLEILQINSENDIKMLNEKIDDLNRENKDLIDSRIVLEQSFELINSKLAESLKANLVLMDDNQQIVPLKKLIEFLKVENDQIGDYLKSTQIRLQEKEKCVEESNEKINSLNRIIEENQIIIKNLEAENEKHIKEKHIICQQKISDLVANCNKYKEIIENLENEKAKQSEKLTNLNQQIERYKQEQQNFNFKEFVALKRELNFLKEEKERNFANTVSNSSASLTNLPQTPPLPPIKPVKKNLFNFFNQNSKIDK